MAKLDTLWRNITQSVSKLQNTPDSVGEIPQKYVRDFTNTSVFLTFTEFFLALNDSNYQEDYETIRRLLKDRQHYVQDSINEANINEANERKTKLFLEISSSKHLHSSRGSTMSSTTARALARAEGSAAVKKAQTKKIAWGNRSA